MSKVSIIVPIYNVEKYVTTTIESVVNQTEPDIEIILVDDGSTDTSGKICDTYASHDTRIQVIHKTNGGLSSARNAGTQQASCEYVMYLDGDDYLRKNAVERCLEIMQQYPSDFIQFRYKEVKNGESPIVSGSTEDTENIYQAHTSEELFENLYRLGGVAASGATKLFRRELMLKIPFENIRHEDEMWCTRAFQNNLTVTYIPDELYYYVMRDGSIIHSTFNWQKLEKFDVIRVRIDALKKLNFDKLCDKEYNKAFSTILSLYLEVKSAKDYDAQNILKREFEAFRTEIAKRKILSGKFLALFRLMCINFSFIELYDFYWKKMKGV